MRPEDVGDVNEGGVIPLVVTLTWQSIVTAAAIVGAFVAIVNYLKKVFGWFDNQKDQDKEIQSIKEEQELLTQGMLACLKGLVELGCDGSVKTQITAIETHLNRKAHT